MSTFIRTKDPDAILDYMFDWRAESPGPWLRTGETITAVAFTVASGITEASHTNDADTATIWLSGGTAGVDYDVACKVTTNQGRTDERTLTVRVRNL